MYQKHLRALLLALILSIPATLTAKTLQPFHGLTWGMSKEQVKEKMKTVKGAELSDETTTDRGGSLTFAGGASHMGFPVTDWTFLFAGDSLFSATAGFDADPYGAIVSTWKSMTEKLIKEHGTPDQWVTFKTLSEFRSVWSDEHILEMIQNEENALYAYWNYTESGREYTLKCSIDDSGYLSLGIMDMTALMAFIGE